MTYDELLKVSIAVTEKPSEEQAIRLMKNWEVFYKYKQVSEDAIASARIICKIYKSVQNYYPELFI